MSTLVTKNVQVGTSATSSQNFLLYQPSTPDGTARIAYGASGSQTDVLTVTNGGNVGIGTSSPNAKLHVAGTIISGAAGGEGGELTLLNPDNSSTGMVVDVSSTNNGRIFNTANNFNLQIGQLGGTGGQVLFYTAASERVRIDGNGNVGIGTSSPTNIGSGYPHLEVNGTTTGVISVSANGVRGLTLAADNNTASIQARVSGQPLTFFTNNAGTVAERARIDNTGNVGIGTAGPGYRLDVQGGRSMFTPSSENYAIGMRYNTGTSAVWLGSPAADTFAVFAGGGGELMRVRSNGSMSFSGQQLVQNFYQSGTFTPTSTKWWRVCTLPATNQGQHVEFIFTIPGQHIQLKVKLSKTTAGALGGGGILEVEQLGSYAYWNYCPFDWRLYDVGTNNPTHLDIRFPSNAGEAIGYRIQVLNSWSADSPQHATFPISDQGTGTTGSYYVNMGNAFSGWTRQWFKLTGSKYAFLDSSLTLSSGQTAPTA